MRQHRALGLIGRARGRHDEGVAFLYGQPVVEGVLLAVAADDPGGAQGLEHGPAGRRRQAGIERRHGVARVPDGLERVRQTPFHQGDRVRRVWHRPVA